VGCRRRNFRRASAPGETKLARHPFITSDYVVKDASGREIEHLMLDGFIIAYWVDVPVKLVMIVEVDDVE